MSRALRLHAFYRGKVQVAPKCAIRDLRDFAVWYTPGVADPCKAIEAEPERVFEHTNKGNTIAIVTDGSRVLGLGNIGPEAALPVMEGKALLFKYLGGVDAVPVCLKTRDADDLVRCAAALEPSFGGINLEDISAPQCFRVLDGLRAEMKIPVWHDDQQGTAAVLYAAFTNALEVVGKSPRDVRIAMIGMGAANVAVYRLLVASGVDPGAIVACDSKGTLHRGRADVEREKLAEKWLVCTTTNADGVQGGIREALAGADVCIAFAGSGPIVRAEWVRTMRPRAIVFACGNPIPEIWPAEATDAGAEVVCTGRGDFPNQLNNSLAFPGIFRGALDVRASRITDEMALAAGREIARRARERGLSAGAILPFMDDVDLAVREAVAIGMTAQEQGVARLRMAPSELEARARTAITEARAMTADLMASGRIRPLPTG